MVHINHKKTMYYEVRQLRKHVADIGNTSGSVAHPLNVAWQENDCEILMVKLV